MRSRIEISRGIPHSDEMTDALVVGERVHQNLCQIVFRYTATNRTVSFECVVTPRGDFWSFNVSISHSICCTVSRPSICGGHTAIHWRSDAFSTSSILSWSEWRSKNFSGTLFRSQKRKAFNETMLMMDTINGQSCNRLSRTRYADRYAVDVRRLHGLYDVSGAIGEGSGGRQLIAGAQHHDHRLLTLNSPLDVRFVGDIAHHYACRCHRLRQLLGVSHESSHFISWSIS